MNVDEFWNRMDKRGGPDSCWLWLGAHTSGGYGSLNFEGRSMRANRLALELTSGKSSLCALHHCDVPACCNPAHLYWGTKHENARDRQVRGRNNSHKRAGLANGVAIDLALKRFGSLVVLRIDGGRKGLRGGNFWMCVCDCGAVVSKFARYLICGDTKSCGCARYDTVRARMRSERNPGRSHNRKARGKCDSEQGRKISADRMRLAAKLEVVR